MNNSITDTISEFMTKGATRWTIVCGCGYAVTGVVKAFITKHYVDALDSLGYLFIIIGIGSVRRSVVLSAAEAKIDRANLANSVIPAIPNSLPVATTTIVPSSTDPATQREIERRITYR